MAINIAKLFTGMPLPNLPQVRREWDLERYQLELFRFHEELLEYLRRLMAQLGGAVFNTYVTEIINETVTTVDETVVTNWQYDATSHKFQIKTKQVKTVATSGAESSWTNATGTQPTQISDVSDWQYNATTHAFQVKTRPQYVLEASAESAFGNAGSSQPTAVTAMTDWQYNTTTHTFQKKTRASMYVLETAAESSLTNTSGGQPVNIVTAVTDVDYSTTTHIVSQDYRSDVYVLEMGAATTAENIDTAEACA